MKKGFKQFDKVFLINLDKRSDRLDARYKVFKEYGVDNLVERYRAVPPPINEFNDYINDGKKIKLGEYGCISSHVNIIKMAKANKWKSVLVLEDDVEFINHEYIDSAIDQLQGKEWDLFYLGNNTHTPLSKADKNLLNLKEGYATHAVAYHERFYDQIISAFDKKEIEIIDVWLSEVGQAKGNSYCSYPITAIQENSFSDIHNQVIDYSWMISKFKINTQHLKD